MDDPCVKCSCTDKRLTCMKKACPVLQCPISKQKKKPGQCCPTCTEQRELMNIPGNTGESFRSHKNVDINLTSFIFTGKCQFATEFHSFGHTFVADFCSKCSCMNGTSLCHRQTCPVLECEPSEQKIRPGECCPTCPPGGFKEVCSLDGKIYQV